MAVTVREKKKGSGEWWIFINHQGKRKAKKVGTDKKMAKDVARKIEQRLVVGGLGLLKPNASSFKKYAEEWLARPHNWKESTKEDYTSKLRNHVYPRIGGLGLDRIGKREVRVMLDDLLKGGLSTKTVKCVRAVVSGVLNAAAEDDLVERNVLRDVKAKGGDGNKGTEPKALTAKEAIALLEKAEGTPYHPMILCGLTTGLRLGEIEELRWKDVDLDERVIEVKRSHRKGRVTDTKNHHNRRVDVPQILAQLLRELKIQCKEKLWKKNIEEELVFKRIGRTTLRTNLHKLLEEAKLERRRFHDLRHTYASLRLLKGDNIGDVSKQLGHASIQITFDVYGHWIPSSFKSEVDELGQMFQPDATYTQPEVEIGSEA